MEHYIKTNFMKRLKENYMYINIVFLILCIYIIFFPFFFFFLENIFPALLQCPYKEITGKPCPLCGGTRYIANIGTVFHDITYLFNFFGIFMICVFIEIISRIYIIIRIKRKKNIDTILKIDIIWHILLIVAFASYEIIYIVIQQCL